MWVDATALRMIRDAELRTVVSHFPPGSRILEVGGGSGWQAATLASLGYEVESVDLDTNPYSQVLEWPVKTYDGKLLPFRDRTFDIVFSSNVLEHVPDLDGLMREIGRVIKPDGLAVHLMPTPQWRLTTFVAHYPWAVKLAIALIGRRPASSGQRMTVPDRPGWWILRRVIAAPRHGEHGTALGELWTFRRAAWVSKFEGSGWRLEADWGVGILYSGYFVCHPWLGLKGRSRLARFCGSSCRVYLLRRAARAP